MASYDEACQSQNPDRLPGFAVEFMVSGDDAGLKVLPPAEVPTVKARVLGNHRIVCGGIFTGGDVFDAAGFRHCGGVAPAAAIPAAPAAVVLIVRFESVTSKLLSFRSSLAW
jgi:hypothetical protein